MSYSGRCHSSEHNARWISSRKLLHLHYEMKNSRAKRRGGWIIDECVCFTCRGAFGSDEKDVTFHVARGKRIAVVFSIRRQIQGFQALASWPTTLFSPLRTILFGRVLRCTFIRCTCFGPVAIDVGEMIITHRRTTLRHATPRHTAPRHATSLAHTAPPIYHVRIIVFNTSTLQTEGCTAGVDTFRGLTAPEWPPPVGRINTGMTGVIAAKAIHPSIRITSNTDRLYKHGFLFSARTCFWSESPDNLNV